MTANQKENYIQGIPFAKQDKDFQKNRIIKDLLIELSKKKKLEKGSKLLKVNEIKIFPRNKQTYLYLYFSKSPYKY